MELLDSSSWLRVFFSRGQHWKCNGTAVMDVCEENIFYMVVCALSDASILHCQAIAKKAQYVNLAVKAPNVPHIIPEGGLFLESFSVKPGSKVCCLCHSLPEVQCIYVCTLWTYDLQRFPLLHLLNIQIWVKEGISIKWSWFSHTVLAVFWTVYFLRFCPHNFQLPDNCECWTIW